MYIRHKLRVLKKVYLLLILSLMLSCVFGLYAIPGLASAGQVIIPRPIKIGLPIAIMACFPIWWWAGKLLKEAREKEPILKKRASKWVRVKLVQGILLEGLGMLGLMATVLSHDHFFLLSTGFMAGILIVLLPNELKLQIELKLNETELEAIKSINQ